MNLGRIEQVGRPREVYPRPTTLFVADFVGASNRFAATVLERAPGWPLRVDLADLGRWDVAGVPGPRAGPTPSRSCGRRRCARGGGRSRSTAAWSTSPTSGPGAVHRSTRGEHGRVTALAASERRRAASRQSGAAGARLSRGRLTRMWLVPAVTFSLAARCPRTGQLGGCCRHVGHRLGPRGLRAAARRRGDARHRADARLGPRRSPLARGGRGVDALVIGHSVLAARRW